MNDTTPILILTVCRIKGGYRAKARVKTHNGYAMFCVETARKDYTIGVIADPPKAAAMKGVLEQAQEYAEKALGDERVTSRAKAAISATQTVRDLMEIAEDGDSEARVGIKKLSRSPFRVVRKAVHAQRLFKE